MYVGQTRSPIAVIVLSIITCGIYALYWYYVTMEDLNRSLGEECISSATFLILSIFCAPVAWYILYKLDEGLIEISMREGIPYKQNNFIIWLLLTFIVGVGPFVAVVQIQNAFNALWEKRSGRGGFASGDAPVV